MTKLTKTTLFKPTPPRAETLMDKTTRIVRGILDDEAEQRENKTARLRKARLEREAATRAEPVSAKPSRSRAKARTTMPK
ncbi:hypothetical protein [Shimia aestuarii]|uniref:Uncharacterized protein n=1 Tax=Shimia aestuarii TaxID=254406 RepID=A0A1I4PC12_9RHOB|nr:hypothetical protein [Shimia aestuarii]SFM25066.1 hypothetical protein SAMN04488042_105163 [Shimia aestuarii]